MKLEIETIDCDVPLLHVPPNGPARGLRVSRESLLATHAAARQYLRELRASEMAAWASSGGDFLRASCVAASAFQPPPAA